MIELNLSRAVEIVDSLVEEFGEEYVYPPAKVGSACTYVKGGAPSCLVGHILHEIGVPLERLRKADVACFGTSQGADMLTLHLRDEGVVQFTTEARRFLVELQSLQDGGETWKLAKDQALVIVNN